jgi:hypothetical protein
MRTPLPLLSPRLCRVQEDLEPSTLLSPLIPLASPASSPAQRMPSSVFFLQPSPFSFFAEPRASSIAAPPAPCLCTVTATFPSSAPTSLPTTTADAGVLAIPTSSPSLVGRTAVADPRFRVRARRTPFLTTGWSYPPRTSGPTFYSPCPIPSSTGARDNDPAPSSGLVDARGKPAPIAALGCHHTPGLRRPSHRCRR